MFYTRLTVISPKHVSDEEVIYYFVFPTYGVKLTVTFTLATQFELLSELWLSVLDT
eukprot:jgi/Psemu1/61128/gm1.61128_g